MRVTMNIGWVIAAALLPLLAGLLVAWPLWRKRVKDEMGTIAGGFVVFACAIGFIEREYVEVERISASCVERQVGCRFSPPLFNRYAIYGGVAMAQVFALFVVGLKIEERLRRP